MKKEEKMYVVRKYVKAHNAQEALKIEKNQDADECWVDEKWLGEKIVRGFDK
jgi:hypothetical protein